MLASQRQKSLRVLYTSRPNDFALCREVESLCHALSTTALEYTDHVRRATFNLRENPQCGSDVVCRADEDLTEGTLVGRIEEERNTRMERFRHMLLEKYESMNDSNYKAMIRCRRCGSQDVSWEEKQTRSADEAATVFCMCAKCKNRWVLR